MSFRAPLHRGTHSDRTHVPAEEPHRGPLPPLPRFGSSLPASLALFLSSYIVCSVFFQLRSTTPPWSDSAPIEYFTGGLLWLLSFVCLLVENKYLYVGPRFIFWMASCAALAFLAIDERFTAQRRREG